MTATMSKKGQGSRGPWPTTSSVQSKISGVRNGIGPGWNKASGMGPGGIWTGVIGPGGVEAVNLSCGE